MNRNLVLQTPTDTRRFGRILGELCESGDIICMSGELGSGKTTMTQAIAEGAGVDPQEYVCSPSFAILHEYRGAIPIYHMDFYRLSGSDEVAELGLDEYFYRPGLTIIEWCEKALELVPEKRLCLELTIGAGQKRCLTLASSALRWCENIERLLDAVR